MHRRRNLRLLASVTINPLSSSEEIPDMRSPSATWSTFTLACGLCMAPAAVWAQTAPATQAPEPATTVSPPLNTAPSTRIGTLKQIEGEAWAGSQDQRRVLASGDGVSETDRLSTGKVGVATLTLKDGTVLTMGPNTVMDLSKFQFDATTQKGSFLLDLLQGSVRVVTGLLGKINPDLFKVQTPTSVVGVRGTDFIVETQAAR